MPTAKTRSHPRFRFKVAPAKTGPGIEETSPLPWPIVTIGAGVIAAMVGLVLVAAVVVVGWLGSIQVPFVDMLAFAGRVWLLGHGVALNAAGLPVSIIPIGLTVVCFLVAALAGRQSYRRPAEEGLTRLRRQVLLTGLQVSLGYVLTAVVVALVTGTAIGPAAGGAAFVVVPASLLGAAARAGLGRPHTVWLRAALAGAFTGVLGVLAIAAIPLAAAMVEAETRIAALEQSLGFDPMGGVAWAAVCLSYLPNMLMWSAAWVFGAGFTVGDGSLVTPWATQLGLLPSVPMFGALPADGVGSGLIAWMALGLVPGLLAGVVVVRYRAGGVVSAVGAGALSGLLAGIALLGCAVLSRGGLGVARFAEVGPRFPEVAIAVGVLIVTAALTATVAWFVDRRTGSVG